MVKEGVFDRWISLEMGSFMRAFVTSARPLGDLLLEERPVARTRGGEEHVFDKVVLQRFHDVLGPLDRRRLRLPITFFVDKDASDAAYLTDATAIQLLRALGEVPASLDVREGKLWLGHARAQAIARQFPGAFQFAYH